MAIHSVIILFDSTSKNLEGTVTVDFEKLLIKNQAPENLYIFYLKIQTEENKDQIQFVIKENGNLVLKELSPEKFYNFKNVNSLKAAIKTTEEHLQSKMTEDSEAIARYLVSIGDGKGFSFFDKKSDADESINGGIDSLLYVRELIESLGDKKFKLGLFNNCNTTLHENLSLLNKNFNIVIGTENYTAYMFLNFEYFLNHLIDRIKSDIKVFDFSKHIFYSMREKIDDSVIPNTVHYDNLENTTLFLIYLERKMRYLTNNLNELGRILTENYLQNNILDWYKSARNSLSVIKNSYYYIDLSEFIQKIKIELSNENKEVDKFCSLIIKNIDDIVLFRFRGVNVNKSYNGISVYLPEYGKGHTDRYLEYRQIYPSETGWDKFVSEVVDKAKQNESITFLQSLKKAIDSFFR